MSEKFKDWIYMMGIVLIFLLLALITWLIYGYQIHRLDNDTQVKQVQTTRDVNK